MDGKASNEASRAVQHLIASLFQGAHRLILEAHRRVVASGQDSIPLIERELARIDLINIAYRETAAVVVGLAIALHDIDEIASRRFLEKSLAEPIDSTLRAALQSVARFSLVEWRRSSFGATAILEDIRLDHRFEATRHVKQWLGNLSQSDVASISRLYIIESDTALDYAGTYLPILSVITLVWINLGERPNPLTPLARLATEATLYHEVGHHALKHKEFGQVPDQEEAAKAYSRSIFERVHPNWRRFARIANALGWRRTPLSK